MIFTRQQNTNNAAPPPPSTPSTPSSVIHVDYSSRKGFDTTFPAHLLEGRMSPAEYIDTINGFEQRLKAWETGGIPQLMIGIVLFFVTFFGCGVIGISVIVSVSVGGFAFMVFGLFGGLAMAMGGIFWHKRVKDRKWRAIGTFARDQTDKYSSSGVIFQFTRTSAFLKTVYRITVSTTDNIPPTGGYVPNQQPEGGGSYPMHQHQYQYQPQPYLQYPPPDQYSSSQSHAYANHQYNYQQFHEGPPLPTEVYSQPQFHEGPPLPPPEEYQQQQQQYETQQQQQYQNNNMNQNPQYSAPPEENMGHNYV